MSNQPARKPTTHVHRPKKLFSKDGTAIAFDRIGGGSPVILVDGALCYRALGSNRPLAKLLPAFFIALMRLMPVWSKLKAVAHTIPYDGAIVQDNQRGKPLPANRWTSVTVPTLVMDGGKSPGWIRQANRSLASERFFSYIVERPEVQTLWTRCFCKRRDIKTQAIGRAHLLSKG